MKKIKFGMMLLFLMIFAGCASNQKPQTRYFQNWKVPQAQIEDRTLPEYPVCGNEKNGDLLECEKLFRTWGCLVAIKFDLFMRRATEHPTTKEFKTVFVPEACIQ